MLNHGSGSFPFRSGAAVALMILATAGAVAQDAGADEPRERKPARPLPAAMSGILLQDKREDLERPDETIAKMGLSAGMKVADIGCGPGYYTLRLAAKVAPGGTVYAVDIQQEMLDQLGGRMAEAGIENIVPVLGGEDDPKLPEGEMDRVLLVDAYHEFSKPAEMLEGIRNSLAPDGTVHLLEYRAEQVPKSMGIPVPPDHKMSVTQVLSEWLPAGFDLVELAEFLPAQHYFVFRKGEKSAPAEWRTKAGIFKIEGGGAPRLTTRGGDVLFSGQPSREQFETLVKNGVKTVVNLRTAGEMESESFDEAALAAELGVEYVHVPMGQDPLSDSELERAFAALDRAGDGGQVLLHCKSSNRVGHVWALYRGKRGGLDVEAAIREGKAAGMMAPPLIKGAEERLGK